MKNTRLDFLSWAALTAAIVVTASSEYQLGIHAGFGPYMAAGIPAALDIYALRAMRARRDVAVVVIAMIAVNALSHLVSTGLLPVNWPLVVAVSAIAPLVFWRVHLLAHMTQPAVGDAVPETPRGVEDEALQSAPADAPQPAPKAPPAPALERPEPIAQSAPKDAPGAPAEAPREEKPERPQSAPKPKAKAPRKAPSKRPKTATRADAKAALEALYDSKKRRPLESEMQAALVALPGYPHTSRQHANKLRGEIERDRPDLAALGSDNVLALTGS